MSDYVIIAHSTTDLPDELAKQLGIVTMPLSFTIEGKEYKNFLDGREMDISDFYKKIKEGHMATTAQLNTNDYIDIATPILENGKDILFISFSSGLSGTYNSGRLAIEELKEKFPDRTIEIVDGRSASMGEGLLVYLAAKSKNDGKTLLEVKGEVETNVPHLTHLFTVTDIEHLRRGGRVSTIASIFAKVLSIKPILHVDDSGKLVAIGKAIGRTSSIKKLFERMKELVIDSKTVFISHGDDLEDANILAKMIKEYFDVEELIMNPIGPVIGAHAGPGTIALFFLGKHR